MGQAWGRGGAALGQGWGRGGAGGDEFSVGALYQAVCDCPSLRPRPLPGLLSDMYQPLLGHLPAGSERGRKKSR